MVQKRDKIDHSFDNNTGHQLNIEMSNQTQIDCSSLCLFINPGLSFVYTCNSKNVILNISR